MHGVRAADRLRPRLREPEVAHLAGRHLIGHRPHRLLDRHTGVDAVQEPQVDVVEAQVGQAAVDGPPQVLGVAAAGLGGDDRLVASAGHRPPDVRLAASVAVRLGRVDQRDPGVERPPDRAHAGVVLASGVVAREAHAPRAIAPTAGPPAPIRRAALTRRGPARSSRPRAASRGRRSRRAARRPPARAARAPPARDVHHHRDLLRRERGAGPLQHLLDRRRRVAAVEAGHEVGEQDVVDARRAGSPARRCARRRPRARSRSEGHV